MAIIVTFIIFVVAFFVYFLPSIIAYNRKHPDAFAIFLLNFLLGWSFIAWVIALIWSVKSFNSTDITPPTV